MSEKRSLKDIEQEYYGLLPKAGNLQYQIHALTKDLEMLNSTMRDLNLEAAAVKAEEPAPEAPPAPEQGAQS